MAWAQLVRLPNVFTVLADVSAAFLLVSQGTDPVGRFVLVVLAGVSLYWGGMVLNDVFDIDRDRRERPARPIPAGQIPLGHAKAAGWGLLCLGVVLAASSGYLPAENLVATWVPAVVGIVLASMIVAYDGPLKATPLAPVAMGSCRFLSFLLGASPALNVIGDGPLFPEYVIAIALGFGIYVMGITAMARHEATGGPSANLSRGLVLMIIGAAVLAFAPQTAGNPAGWHVSPARVFPIMIGLIAFPVVLRGLCGGRSDADEDPNHDPGWDSDHHSAGRFVRFPGRRTGLGIGRFRARDSVDCPGIAISSYLTSPIH